MTIHRMHLHFEITEIPKAHSVIGRASRKDSLRRWIEGNAVNRIFVKALRGSRRPSCVAFTGIDDLNGDIIRYSTDQGRVKGVILDIVDIRRMVGIRPNRFQSSVAFRERVEVP